MPITHAKVDNKTDWTQAQLDAQIALGNYEAGTVLADLALPSDWNAAHTIDTIVATGGTVTASTPVFSGTQTWNNAAVTFTGFKLNITSTASAAASLLADFQLANTSMFSIRKDGRATAVNFALGDCLIGQRNSAASLLTLYSGSGSTALCEFQGGGGGLYLTTSLPVFGWSGSTSTNSADAGLARKTAKIIEFNTGTASTYAGTAFGNGTQTVAQLPTASTCTGFRAMVSDALTPTFGATVASGGAVVTPVYSDGTNWKVG